MKRKLFKFDCIMHPVGKSDFKKHNLYKIAVIWNPSLTFSNLKKARKFQQDYSTMCSQQFNELMGAYSDIKEIIYRNFEFIASNPKNIRPHAKTVFHYSQEVNSNLLHYVKYCQINESKTNGMIYAANGLISFADNLIKLIEILNLELGYTSDTNWMENKKNQLNIIKRIIFTSGTEEIKSILDLPVAVRTEKKELLLKYFFPYE